MIDVVTFYDEHPINERSILAALEGEGRDLGNLKPEDLYTHDQDHYGHLEAVEAIATRLTLEPGHEVLDVCCGLGGPARYVAHNYGVHVQGVDLNESRIAGAVHLTDLVGLSSHAAFQQADATDLPFEDNSFDAAYSQEAFLHIGDKAALFGELRRVLKPAAALCVTDWTTGSGLEDADRAHLESGFAAGEMLTAEDYRDRIANAGFVDVSVEDLSGWWREILQQRLEMFRSMEEGTVRDFGRERHETYVSNYEFFVGCMARGRLGGARFLAR